MCSIPLYTEHFDGSRGSSMGEQGIKWEEKMSWDLDYAEDLIILDERICKMNEL